MQIFSGVTLIKRKPQSLPAMNHLAISEGTMLARDRSEGAEYENDAYVPRPTWRPLSQPESDVFITSCQDQPMGSWIRVISVPNEVADGFDFLKMIQNEQELATIATSEDFDRARRSLLEYLGNLSSAPVTNLGLSFKKPGLQTVTSDDQFIGLHIDSCYNELLRDRQLSDSRFTLNVGVVARHFIYVNVSIVQMIGELKRAALDVDRLVALGSANKIAKLFLKSFPDYPTVRITLLPGEAYIAPTENILHDGSTLGMQHCDISITARSRFRVE